MRRKSFCAVSGLYLMVAGLSNATTIYVDGVGGSDVSSGLSWPQAKKTIQAGVNVAGAGDTVLVADGTYATGGRAVYGAMTNRVAIDRPITVRSVNGWSHAAIVGRGVGTGGTNNGDGAVRCAYVGANAALVGFTLRGGYTRTGSAAPQEQDGGGAWCEDSGVLSNCLITGNKAASDGGGTFGGYVRHSTLSGNRARNGGGASDASLSDCEVNNNVGSFDAGGGYQSSFSNCTVIGNSSGNRGGGVDWGGLDGCTVISNRSNYGGGAANAVFRNCKVSGNTAGNRGGGAYFCSLYNSVLNDNSAASLGGGDYGGNLYNCTVSANLAGSGGGCYSSYASNSVVYYNAASTGANFSGSTFAYTCTTPNPGAGPGNLTAEPKFVNWASRDLHLDGNSPCINAGNNAYVVGTTDADGLPRIAGGTVDMGGYEFQYQGLWYGATYLGNGGWSSWFGDFAVLGGGWIYHRQHGVLYASGAATDSIWLYASDLGWLWTSPSVYPSLYRVDPGVWLYYQVGSSVPRWFYNFSSGQWENPTLWDGAELAGSGWRYLSWFGYFKILSDGWIQHRDHGLMYPVGSSVNDIWLYAHTLNMGWLWTSRAQYPMFYSQSEAAWLYYLKGSYNPNRFYNFSTQAWESH